MSEINETIMEQAVELAEDADMDVILSDNMADVVSEAAPAVIREASKGEVVGYVTIGTVLGCGIIYGTYKLGTKVIVPGAKKLGANVAGFFAKRSKKDDVVDADYTELDDEDTDD